MARATEDDERDELAPAARTPLSSVTASTMLVVIGSDWLATLRSVELGTVISVACKDIVPEAVF